MRYLAWLLVLALASCKAPANAPVRTATPRPNPVQVGEVSQLVGKVKLRLDPASLVANNGGGIISEHGAGIISNNAGQIVSNNAGQIIGKVKRQLLAAPEAFALADARIEVFDAAGKAIAGEDGKPLVATTDARGNYKLAGKLPRRNLILRIKLWNGGELSALLPAGTGEQAISTATTLGASYVLQRYVKGSQEVLDRLPEAEAVRLERELDAAEQRLESVPEYRPEALSSFVDALRGREPAVDKSLADVAAILLGQRELGSGRAAVQVALGNPQGLVALPGGDFLVGEGFFGRIRKVSADGKLENFADRAYGQVKYNFNSLVDMLRGPDGTLYLAQDKGAKVFRIKPDNSVEDVAGTGLARRGAVGGPATAAAILPRSIALMADGTLLIGEREGYGDDSQVPPRLLALGGDGLLKLLDDGQSRGIGTLAGVAATADGTIYMLQARQGRGVLFKRLPDGKVSTLREGLECSERARLLLGPADTPYVSEDLAHRVTALDADGKTRVVAGAGGPAATAELVRPGALAFDAEGTLLIADQGRAQIHALTPDGRWQTLAGARETLQAGDASAIALNAPNAVAIAADGTLAFSESGGSALKRLKGEAVELIAGAGRGYAGDGAAAVDAYMETPTGLVYRDGTLYFHDNGNGIIRAVAPDGTITTVVGSVGALGADAAPGHPIDAKVAHIRGGIGLTVGPDGLLYWTEAPRRQVLRLNAAGKVEVVAGRFGNGQAIETNPEVGDGGPAQDASLSFPLGLAFAPDGSLYVADSGHFRVRRISGLQGPGKPMIETVVGQPMLDALGRVEGDAPPDDGGRNPKDAAVFLPGSLTFDQAGNLYIGELGTANLALLAPLAGQEAIALDLPPVPARVRKVDSSDPAHPTISTVAGPGGAYFADPQALDKLVLPTGLGLDPGGRLVIVDGGANQLRFLPAGRF